MRSDIPQSGSSPPFGPPPGRSERPTEPSCCVLLAAGAGRRPAGPFAGRPWPLVRVLGLSLAERTVATCMAAGVERFVVVIAEGAEDVRVHYERIALRRGCRLHFVETPDAATGAQLRAARSRVPSGPFLVVPGDRLIGVGLLERLLEAPPGPGEVSLAVDRDRAALADPNQAVKVGLANDRVTRIGRDVRWWSAAFVGVMLCQRDVFETLDRAAEAGGDEVPDGLARLAAERRLRGVSVTGEPWLVVDSAAALRQARMRLLGALAGGRADGFVSAHLNRRLSRRLTSRLAERAVTPNQVTMAAFLAALAGAGFLATGDYMLGVVGALLVQASSIVDGCDGELARLTHQVTPRGAWLDTVLDRYADLAVVTAVTFAHAQAVAGLRPWLGGMLAVTGFLLASYVTKEFALRHGREYPNDVLNRLRRRDLRLFGISLGALGGMAFEAMVLLGLVSHMCAAGMLLRAWRRQGPFGYRAA